MRCGIAHGGLLTLVFIKSKSKVGSLPPAFSQQTLVGPFSLKLVRSFGNIVVSEALGEFARGVERGEGRDTFRTQGEDNRKGMKEQRTVPERDTVPPLAKD